MLKFKNFYKRHEPVILGAVLAIALTSLSLLLANVASQGLELSDRLVVMQITLSSVAFVGVFIALMIAFAQFRKSMAKPKLRVIFSESGKSEISIDILKGKEVKHELKLSVINKGNAITKLFQINFIVPAILRPRFDAWSALFLGIPSPPLNPLPNMSESKKLISFCSYDKVYCFINEPARINTLLLETLPEEYNNYPDKFIITYSIYGDWAETQKGELTVRIQKETGGL